MKYGVDIDWCSVESCVLQLCDKFLKQNGENRVSSATCADSCTLASIAFVIEE